ncbi:MAG: anhydro-N-acetylmuramic acid kinase [Armatimonadetes bacterium]|nr:anhydro-N-acetylmuramic acid kinase [Armatimonadota bacterium]
MGDWQTLVGLMSGTSTDGVDAAVVRFWEERGRPRLKLLAFLTVPYDDAIRRRLLDCALDRTGIADLARLNFLVGERLADAAAAAIGAAGLSSDDIVAVGSHGHTVAHLPTAAGDMAPAATLQIGETAVIAERLGIPVVGDFRVRDVAAGGQGAPLVPYFDYCFLRSDRVNRVALNIGGIANITVIPRGCTAAQVTAYDIGPGNMPLDTAVRQVGPPGWECDRDGTLARRGAVHDGLLRWVLGHEFLARPAPKSCGREEFGEGFVAGARAVAPGLSAEDLLATLTATCGQAIGAALSALPSAKQEVWEVIASGGGTRNPALMDVVRRHAGMPVRSADDFGIPSDAKEAVAFAFLAWETLRGRPANLPGATGARGPRVLGKITPEPRTRARED